MLAATIIGCLLIGGTAVTILWFTSSSVVVVPKAEQHEINSRIAHARSIVLEQQADQLRKDFEAAEMERDELKRQLAIAKSNAAKQDEKTNGKRKEYEKVRKTPVVVSDRDLNARERQLGTDLDELYR